MSATVASERRGRRNQGLDLIRASAIAMVLIAHTTTITWGASSTIARICGPAGVLGVELFFVLSGYLIGGILLRPIEKSGTLSGTNILEFWKRRWWRTLPNYLLFLLLSIVAAHPPASHVPRDFGKFFLFAQNLTPLHPIGDTYGISWSLCVEEWEYVLLPLVTLGWLSLLKRRGIKVSVGSLLAICTLLIAPFTLRCLTGSGLQWDRCFRKCVCYRLDSIAFGALLAWIGIYRPEAFRIMGRRVASVVAIVVIAITLVFIEVSVLKRDSWSTGSLRGFYLNVVALSSIDFATMFLVAFAVGMQDMPPMLARVVTYVSLTSYSAYLVHLSVINWVQDNARQMLPNTAAAHGLEMVLMLLAALFVSGVLYQGFEVRMTNLRDSSKSKQGAAA